MSSGSGAREPRDAASLVLARPGDPWSVLMFRRPAESAFAPGSFVFPGGAVEPHDRLQADPWREAAIRETFEEVGIFVGRRPDGILAGRSECDALRRRLAAGAGWPEALRQAGLVPAPDRLLAIDRWVTPPVGPRRFDTSFYLTLLPPGQDAVPDGREVVEIAWVLPGDANLSLLAVTQRILDGLAAVDLAGLDLSAPEKPPPPARMARVRDTKDGTFEYLGFEIVGDGSDRAGRPIAAPIDRRTNDC